MGARGVLRNVPHRAVLRFAIGCRAMLGAAGQQEQELLEVSVGSPFAAISSQVDGALEALVARMTRPKLNLVSNQACWF